VRALLLLKTGSEEPAAGFVRNEQRARASSASIMMAAWLEEERSGIDRRDGCPVTKGVVR
jgi:hypothetical protein